MSLYRIAHAAQRDLDEIWCHFGSFDVRDAERWLGAVEHRFKILARLSRAGQARPDLAHELQFLPVGNYRILYRPIENGVEIVRVIHGSRHYGPEFV